MTGKRQTTTRNVAWFLDLRRRDALNLDPPYQRRSVWNRKYREYFIETILLNLPAPSLFLFEQIDEDGALGYSVVDGKQRLCSVFAFVDGEFPVPDATPVERLRGQYFSDFGRDERKQFFEYEFIVELLPTSDSSALNDIFDRINRNVRKLTPQELRHAKWDGVFAKTVEELADESFHQLPLRFPNIAESSRRQMKDVEFVALLLLLVENGPQSTPQDFLDEIYAGRDEEWDDRRKIVSKFRRVLTAVATVADAGGNALQQTRLRNQGDFYALFGAIAEVGKALDPPVAARQLQAFFDRVGEEEARAKDVQARTYYDAARSAANDARQRRIRIDALKAVISGT